MRLVGTEACYAGTAPPNEFVLRLAGIGERTIREGVKRLARS